MGGWGRRRLIRGRRSLLMPPPEHDVLFRHDHVQLGSGHTAHAIMIGPGAFLESQLLPVDLQLILLDAQNLQIMLQFTAAVLDGYHRDGTRQVAQHQQGHDQRLPHHDRTSGAAVLAATRMMALRARGFAATSAASARTALPIRRNAGCGTGTIGSGDGSGWAWARIKRLTIRSSSE